MVVVWNRTDYPGKEWCQLRKANGNQILEGIVVLTYGHKPCRLEYYIQSDRTWQTQRALIKGQIGKKKVSLELKVNAKKQWLKDGAPISSVEGCIDIDLGFSPSTNLLPIRRLKLGVGEKAEVTAAWVEFPTLKVKPLVQSYLRSKKGIYHYESAGGKFKRDLIVNEEGLVTRYPGLWQMEAVL